MNANAFTNWRKSTYSSGNPQQCIEVGEAPGLRGVRDSKLGVTSPVLAFKDSAWSEFVAMTKSGSLDR
ncbi:DUF397 domain-containing protein [Saccharopolyspora sp. TS4A08]|uniref:DUF397 domain-containing protein n=1 Tax=Saccharopolyspora ipomoeae TaxID=3042027 RepID=A0ABT6PUD7_9PSEU|nr:DUF397 domain-containing protein [Saccharopolyspora sp. TS4A08]MDI2031581.1 DUF397 domain-containing protein [Saccharopolyspora sp. TS4A08]